MVGYHAREGGGDGVVNHTLLGRTVYEIRVNGQPVDEAGLNAGIAGAYGVPIALLTGDDVVTADAEARFPGVATAAVKRAIDRYTAESLGVEESHALIRARAKEAVARLKSARPAPYDPGRPYRFEVDFKGTAAAHMCALFPQVERVGARTIAITDDDYVRGFKQLWGCLIVGMGTINGLL